MTQNESNTVYLFCSGCSKKYINDEEHIKQDFGYNRLNIRYKSCVQCQARYAKHRESHKEERREHAKQYYYDNKDEILSKKKEYREQHYEEQQEQSKQIVKCDVCGSMVRNGGLARHKRTSKCKKAISVEK